MKERPILFSGAMVRAILAGSKTQTRRIYKPRRPSPWEILDEDDAGKPWPFWQDECGDYHAVRCPYGQPGDRLWVRENGWERPERTPHMMREGADTWPKFAYDADAWNESDHEDFKRWGFKRRPSIHMPRWASRTMLEIVAVRAERLRDISEADARAEGALGGHGSIPGYAYNATPLEHFHHIWEGINGAGSFAANPYVWVITFKRVEA